MYKDVEKSLADGDPEWYSRSPEEQHEMILKRIGLFFNAPGMTGMTGAPVLIDENKGQPVSSPVPSQGALPSGADAPQQGLPETHQVQKGEPLPEPKPRGSGGRYAGMPFDKRQAPEIVQEQSVDGDEPAPVPANKPPSREQLFQKWQERKPSNNKEHAARQDEKKILQMMGERANPEKVAKAVASKFPYHKLKLMTPEFKELVESYIQDFSLDPKMGWQVKKPAPFPPVGLDAPLSKANPKRKNATISD